MHGLNNSSGIPVMPALAKQMTDNPQWFTEGGNGVEPSSPGADWFNMIQAELINVIFAANIIPDNAQLNQIANAISAISKKNIRDTTFFKSFYDFGAVGDGVADDTDAILAAISAVKEDKKFRLVQFGGKFKYSKTLPFNDAPDIFSSTESPSSFFLQCEMIYTGIDKAVNCTGNSWGYNLFIETLTGSGVIPIGAVGSSSENIGLYIGPNSGCHVNIVTITNFNQNILFDGAYFNHVRVDYSYRCRHAAVFRKHPTLGYLSNSNNLTGCVLGGPYLKSSDPDYEEKRLNNAEFGLIMSDSLANNITYGGIEYCVRTDNGLAIDLKETTASNIIRCHSEGGLTGTVRDLGDNRLFVDGVNSQNISGDAVYALGIGGSFGPISKQGTESQKTTFAPHHGQGDVRIHPSKTIEGAVFVRDVMSSGASKYNIATSQPGTSAFIRSDTATTSVSAGASYPAEVNPYGGEQSYLLTSSTDSTVWFTVGPYSLSGITDIDMMFSAFIRGAANNLKCSIFILNESMEFVDSLNLELRSNTPYKTIKFPFKRGNSTHLYYRIALRGFEGSGGGSIEFFRPCITSCVASELHSKVLLGEPNKRHIIGNVLSEPIMKKYADIERIVANQVISTAFQVNGLHFVKFSNVAGGTTINAFTNVTPGQEFTLLNISGSTLTVSAAAMGIGAGLAIADKMSMRFLCDDAGVIYPLRQ